MPFAQRSARTTVTASVHPLDVRHPPGAKNQVGTEVADQVVYVNTAVDSDNQPLDGTNTYILHFEPGQTPPVAGMWNIAMYDGSMLFTVNEIDRFSIGSTTDGLTDNPDGSLTIYLQHARPPQDLLCNWLPAGSFNLPHAVLHPPGSSVGQDLQAPRRASATNARVNNDLIAPEAGRDRVNRLSGFPWSSSVRRPCAPPDEIDGGGDGGTMCDFGSGSRNHAISTTECAGAEVLWRMPYRCG